MKITAIQFEDYFEKGVLTLTLIGMSGMGKSYRAKQLAELGFIPVCCDDLIASNISELLPSNDVSGLAAWMGQPYADDYQNRERRYLELEEKVTGQAVEGVKGNTVIDTTGSIIYISSQTQAKLKAKTLIVYLEANQEVYEQMFQVYMTNPKPVVWENAFDRKEGESGQDTLKRCYPELLRYRAKKYEALADVTLPFEVARDEKSSGAQFLQVINERLEM